MTDEQGRTTSNVPLEGSATTSHVATLPTTNHVLASSSQHDEQLRVPPSHSDPDATGVRFAEGANSSSQVSTPSAVSSPSRPRPDFSAKRNRGYSLRRSLFAQGLQKRDEEHGAVMEMEASSSNQQTLPSEKSVKDAANVAIDRTSSNSLRESGPYSIEKQQSRVLPTGPRLKGLGHLPRPIHAFLQSSRDLYHRTIGPKALPSSVDGRHVKVNVQEGHGPTDERTGKPYIVNRIRSCKYTLWNFLPKQLVAQFGKLANFYFLVISILQMIPGLSTTGTFTTIVPLLIFVSVSMAKEGYEDICRNRLDKEDNERITHVLNGTAHKNEAGNSGTITSASPCWSKKKWQDVKVGDVILLERNDFVPADLVLLQASGSEHSAQIETKSLDGETNLKNKKPLHVVSQRCQDEGALANLEADFIVEDPNLDLYKFDGRIAIAGETLPLTTSEVIYRGSILRNTLYAIGIVVYSGEECKIRMNANKNPRVKSPSLQRKVNKVVVLVAGLVFFIAIILSVGYVFWKRAAEDRAFYLIEAEVPFGHVFTAFVIMLNTMLPLSLYISLEIVKVAQMFMMNDIDMYDESTDTPMEPHTSNLNEELGQIDYIFSDKTGTLTNNSMKFRKMSIAGTAWLHDNDLFEENVAGATLKHKKRSKGKSRSGKQLRAGSKATLISTDRNIVGDSALETYNDPTRRTEELLKYISRRPQSLFASKVRFFLLALALCHTCIPEKDEDGNIDFQAASPDELALVTAAQDLGFIMTDRSTNTITVKAFGSDGSEPIYETYQVLDVIEFSSIRKRMSILVRLPDNRICLFTKGADTIIRQLLAKAEVATLHVENIRRQSEARKSLEARAAMQRRSSQVNRNSLSQVAARSTSVGRQSSVSLGRKHSIRASVDLWLKERENESLPRRSNAMQTPRQSQSITPFTPAANKVSSDTSRDSFQTDDLNDVIDEAITINESAIFERCFTHIDEFASAGLRTLVYGHRFVPEAEYREWKEMYHAAATSLTDRQQKIEKVAEAIERQLELTGATAIEDKLQVGVPDAIERFRRAGIKIWMLTGDKRETAINIGHSCRLIKDYSHVMILDHESGTLLSDLKRFVKDVQGGHPHTVLVVDGQTLTVIDTDESHKSLFTDLAIATDSVVCCRASPSQKADLVKTVRLKVSNSVTLAIGDGANDIAMIQEAHVGIGIAGKEGLQAARTSDYSIGQFRFLVKLLLVHGHWNYVRVCKYTLGTFWKEMLFYLVQATYQRWNGYTGTSLFEPWSLSMFNTLFTSLPVIFMGTFEKDLASSTLLAVPELYTFGHQNRGFNIPLYAWWAFIGAIEAMMVYFTMWGIYGEAQFTRDNQLFAMGALAFTACVTLISLKLQFYELHNKNLMAALAIFLSIGGWWLWNLILSSVYDPEHRLYNVNGGLTRSFGRNPLWWLTVVLIVLIVSVFEIIIKVIKTVYFPNDIEVFQVYERDSEIKKRFEESASTLLQQGWDRGNKKSSIEILQQEQEQARREAEIQDILDRPRTMPDSSFDAPPISMRKRQSWAPTDLETIPTNQEVPVSTVAHGSRDTDDLFVKNYGMRKDSVQ